MDDFDNLLLRRLRDGDEVAFAKVFDHYHYLFYSLAYRYLKSVEEAEDAVQYTFMKLWERRDSFDFSGGIRSLLFTIMKNYILNELRHQKVILAGYYVLARDESLLEDSFLRILEKKDMSEHIHKAINRLPDQKKMVCFLKIEKGLTNQEIAERMQITLSTVKSHYTQAIKMLRKELDGLFLILFIVHVVIAICMQEG